MKRLGTDDVDLLYIHQPAGNWLAQIILRWHAQMGFVVIPGSKNVSHASQMQKLQEVLVKQLSENTVSDYLQTTNVKLSHRKYLNP